MRFGWGSVVTENVDSWSTPHSESGANGFTQSDSCLTIDDVLQFVQGQLDALELHRVHEHVDRCELCQRLVHEGVHALDSHPLFESAPPSWNTVFQPNTLVEGRYRILRLVARGGMGEVYEAYDTALQERLAIKTVTSTACDSLGALKCLKAEVQLTRRISHPNVCRIYDLGAHSDAATGTPTHFLAMEYVEGECLGRKLRSTGALPLVQSTSIAQQLLLGLRAAHAAGVLHRDLKSDNVMLRADPRGDPIPVILDFGLAKALNESGCTTSTVMQGQGMIGTVGYMAPEQIEGHPLTVRSDLYAFGVVCFEMLTGVLPFTGGSPAAAAMARLHRAPVPPSRLNPEVPGWLDKIVLRCLSRHAQRRYDSAQAVLDAIREATARGSQTRRRAPWLALALTVAAAALALSPPLTRTSSHVDPIPRLHTPLTHSVHARLRLVLPPHPPAAPPIPPDSRKARLSPASTRVSTLRTPQLLPTDAPPRPTPPSQTQAVVPPKKPRWLPIWSGSTAAAAAQRN
jgi:serine/threonine protein kinase